MVSLVEDFAAINARLNEIEKTIPKKQSEKDTHAEQLAAAISESWMYAAPPDFDLDVYC